MDDRDGDPVNTTPEALSTLYETALVLLQNYGWFLLLGIIALFYLKSRLQPTFARWQNRHSEEVNLHRYDDERILERQQALEESRRRMQENFNAQAARYAEEQLKKEEEKRQQKISDWDRHVEGRGYRSKYRPPDETRTTNQLPTSSSSANQSKKKVYRTDDYSPLSGGGGGSGNCYRPDRRSGARGGGG